MDIGKVAKNFGKFVVLPVVGIPIIGALLNYSFIHNRSYETENSRSFTKADGIIGHTRLEENKNTGEINIQRSRVVVYQTFEAEKGNNYVSTFNNGQRTYWRDKDGLAFPTTFKEADQDYRVQIKRFKPLMNR